MTIVTTTAICLAALMAFFLGRCSIISCRRAARLRKKEKEVKTLEHRLDEIENTSRYNRYYELDEDEDSRVYNVFMKVYVRESSYAGERIESVCWCLIKTFPFTDDKEFARLEATELLDKLNEK